MVTGDAHGALSGNPDEDGQLAGYADTAALPAEHCPGGAGCPCDSDDECSGLCLDTPTGRQCSQSCDQTCPQDYSCLEAVAPGGDTLYVCAPAWGWLCEPCQASAACQTAIGAKDAVCVDYGGKQGSFCGAACENDGDCPGGYVCGEAQSIEGTSSLQCLRLPDKNGDIQCPCDDRAIAQKMATKCTTGPNGTCPGERVCTPDGLTGCEPFVGVEVCNGQDDDCNGQTDDVPCDDGNPCTADACNVAKGACGHTLLDGPCDDGDACTTGETCAEGGCQGGQPLGCDDGNLCTSDSCASGQGCVHENNGQACSDGNACTVGDVCQQGACQSGGAPDCDDGNPCTDDACDPALGSCQHAHNQATCDDGNPCTLGDVCGQGKCSSPVNACDCQTDADCAAKDDANLCNGKLFCDKAGAQWTCQVAPGSVVTCDGGNDTLCASNVCDAGTGKCGFVAKNQGGKCDADGSVCTANDSCQQGACTTGAKIDCDDGNGCTQDVCDAALGCQHVATTAPCSDGNGCTANDACQGGACKAGPSVACDDGNPCTSDSCDSATGKCLYAPNDLPCDDGNACSQGDFCQAGACAGKAVSCADGNPCTDDSCNAQTGCSYAPNNLPCSDGNACTQGDVCQAGTCKGVAAVVEVLCDDGNACTDDGCSPAVGCTYMPNSAPCTDGNGCTVGDVCAGGGCQAGVNTCGCATDADCGKQEDGNLCNGTLYCDKAQLPWSCQVKPGTVVQCDASTDSFCSKTACNPVSGLCGLQGVNEGKPCDADGSVCSAGDACSKGTCMPGQALDCDDGNPCTSDACDPAAGCTHVPNPVVCSDGNPCTIGDLCVGGSCAAGAAKDCDDGNGCTTDSCSGTTGACAHVANTKVCDDGNACTASDVCASGGCVGKAVSCDDGNPCTSDACDPQDGCGHVATGAIACSDGNACTDKDTCQDGTCVGGVAKVCLDGNPCTNDSCSPASGCSFAPNVNPCDDGNACTDQDTCAKKACVGQPLTCNDGNPCTTDSCNSATGCVFAPNGQPCSDGSVCTQGDLCTGGACQPGTALDCDDGNGCTTDACDAKVGCLHVNHNNACDDGNGCTVGDVCGGGKCVSGSNLCGCAQDSDCAGDEDGNLCNGSLFCDKSAQPWQCKVKPASKVTCDTAYDTFCQQSQCNPATGKCALQPVHEGQGCDADGSLCTPVDVCKAGTCQAGALLNCDDGNVCTTDKCDAQAGCVLTANTGTCSDGNACTQSDLCQGGACMAGLTKTCDDGSQCTLDSCNPVTGLCVYNGAAMAGQGCDADGSVCTAGDTCQSGKCVPGPQLDCDDGNGCTNDACKPASGCNHTANSAACNDNNSCTGPDICSGGVCAPKAVACDDGNPCTKDTCDVSGGCKHAILPDKTACGQTDLCWSGVCKPGVCGDTVAMSALGEQCDDGNTFGGDGCSATCTKEDPACADGTRDGLMSTEQFPDIAQCAGPWLGPISGVEAAALCGKTYHVCTQYDVALMKQIPQWIAVSIGCWAINATNHGGGCGPCDDKEGSNNMAGIGSSCPSVGTSGSSCISPDYKIDAATGTCTRTGSNMPYMSGVLCCKTY